VEREDIHVHAARDHLDAGAPPEPAACVDPTLECLGENDDTVSAPECARLVALQQAILEAVGSPVASIHVFITRHAATIEDELRAREERRHEISDRRREIAPTVDDVRSVLERRDQRSANTTRRLPDLHVERRAECPTERLISNPVASKLSLHGFELVIT